MRHGKNWQSDELIPANFIPEVKIDKKIQANILSEFILLTAESKKNIFENMCKL